MKLEFINKKSKQIISTLKLATVILLLIVVLKAAIIIFKGVCMAMELDWVQTDNINQDIRYTGWIIGLLAATYLAYTQAKNHFDKIMAEAQLDSAKSRQGLKSLKMYEMISGALTYVFGILTITYYIIDIWDYNPSPFAIVMI